MQLRNCYHGKFVEVRMGVSALQDLVWITSQPELCKDEPCYSDWIDTIDEKLEFCADVCLDDCLGPDLAEPLAACLFVFRLARRLISVRLDPHEIARYLIPHMNRVHHAVYQLWCYGLRCQHGVETIVPVVFQADPERAQHSTAAADPVASGGGHSQSSTQAGKLDRPQEPKWKTARRDLEKLLRRGSTPRSIKEAYRMLKDKNYGLSTLQGAAHRSDLASKHFKLMFTSVGDEKAELLADPRFKRCLEELDDPSTRERTIKDLLKMDVVDREQVLDMLKSNPDFSSHDIPRYIEYICDHDQTY